MNLFARLFLNHWTEYDKTFFVGNKDNIFRFAYLQEIPVPSSVPDF